MKQVTITIPRPYRWMRYQFAKAKRASAARRRRRAQERLERMPVTHRELDTVRLRIEEQMFTIEDVKEIVDQHFDEEVDIEHEVAQALEDLDDHVSDAVRQYFRDNGDPMTESDVETMIQEEVRGLASEDDIPDEDTVIGWMENAGFVNRERVEEMIEEAEGGVNEDRVLELVRREVVRVARDEVREWTNERLSQVFTERAPGDVLDSLLRGSDVLANFLTNNARNYTDIGLDERVRNIIDQHANDGGVEPQTIRDLQAAIRRLTEQMNNLREGLAALGTDVDVVDSAAAAMSIDLDAA